MANWQGHEKHPTGHKTSEVDWGGHDPNRSDNPPPMPIINLDDLLGSIFLLPMDENGERKRATISEHVKDQVRLKLKIDGDQLDDLNPNHVNESLLSEVDWGAHNPDADYPEQLTGESIQSSLTFVVQLLLWGDLSPMHKSLPCPSLWWHHLDLKTNIYGYISIFPRQHLIQVPIIYTHTHIHTQNIYIS